MVSGAEKRFRSEGLGPGLAVVSHTGSPQGRDQCSVHVISSVKNLRGRTGPQSDLSLHHT